jgi:hypothetical protein
MQRVAPSKGQGCAACHDQESWRVPAFDHARTGFVLENRHATAACAACHKNASPADFSGLVTSCAACHEDIHRGQFSDRKTADGKHVACDRCHVTRDWLAEKFDHEKDSRFPLRGGHERTPCLKCHIAGETNDPRLVQYKPLPTDCKDCHAGTLSEKNPKESS